MVLHPNLEVQVPAVPVVLPHFEVPCDILLPLLGCDVVPEVEHGLLPVSGAGVGAGGEHHLVVAVCDSADFRVLFSDLSPLSDFIPRMLRIWFPFYL